MNYQAYETQLAASYDFGADQYRRDDEIEVRSENHRRLGGNLRRISRSFPRRIRVLEIGCGTGRYFHWLDNVDLLVGVDLSPEMLRRAERPVHADKITIAEIRLMRSNVYEASFPPSSFDFIYSLGVFGYGAEFTAALCQKLHAWLTPGGRLYINAIEVPPMKITERMRKALRAAVYPWFPDGVRRRFDARPTGVPVVRHTREHLERVVEAGGFSDFILSSNFCHSTLWRGTHLECVARKSPSTGVVGERVEPEFAAA